MDPTMQVFKDKKVVVIKDKYPKVSENLHDGIDKRIHQSEYHSTMMSLDA